MTNAIWLSAKFFWELFLDVSRDEIDTRRHCRQKPRGSNKKKQRIERE